jgi:hypothetical protein
MISGNVTELIYEKDVRALTECLGEYLRSKDGVWLLFDNLDKGWPVEDVRREDIWLVRSLLEATRKLQRQLERNDIDCHAVVFIRNDIFSHLIEAIPDKGKDSSIFLDWTEPGTLAEMIRRRIMASTNSDGTFETLWRTFFDSHVGGEESFSYVIGRTLMRPRDVIRFLSRAVGIAVNNGNDRVHEADILAAEAGFSEDQLQEVSFELKDISPGYADLLYAFIGAPAMDFEDGVRRRLETSGVPEEELERAIRLLLWFSFIGIIAQGDENSERYSYNFQYGIDRLLKEAIQPMRFVIHPAFRRALGITDN